MDDPPPGYSRNHFVVRCVACAIARLWPVLCICVLGTAPHCSPLASTKADSVCHRFHHARVKPHAPLEPPALPKSRHTRSPTLVAREVRALFDLMRLPEHEAAEQGYLAHKKPPPPLGPP
jgi:hypothetical protein